MRKIKNRLNELMAEHYTKTGIKLTQQDLSEATGVAQSTISAYTQNKVTRYDTVTLEKLLGFFDCGIGEFFIIEGKETPDLVGSLAPTG